MLWKMIHKYTTSFVKGITNFVLRGDLLIAALNLRLKAFLIAVRNPPKYLTSIHSINTQSNIFFKNVRLDNV